MLKKSYYKTAILTTSVVLHNIFGVSSVLSIMFFAIGKRSKLCDFFSVLSVLSFIFLKRCVAMDMYDVIHSKDKFPIISLKETRDDDCTQDDYIRNSIRKVIGAKPNRGFAPLRLDILSNNEPLRNEDYDIDIMMNHKLHYIIMNVILSVILSVKYNKKILLLILAWVQYSFPL